MHAEEVLTVCASQECGVCRLYSLGSKLSEGAVMAADASLSLKRISEAMHAMFEMLSKPDVLPEFNSLQVSVGIGLARLHVTCALPEYTSCNLCAQIIIKLVML